MTEENKKTHDPALEIPKFNFKNMDFKAAFQNLVKMLKLDKTAIEHVANDDKMTAPALISLVLGAIAAPLGLLVFGFRIFNTTIRIDFGSFLVQAIAQVVMALVLVLVITLVANKLFKGHGSLAQLFRPVGLLYGINILAFFGYLLPALSMLIGVVVGIWMLVVLYVTLKALFKMDDTNTVLTLIVTVIVAMLLSWVLASAGLPVGGMSTSMTNLSITY